MKRSLLYLYSKQRSLKVFSDFAPKPIQIKKPLDLPSIALLLSHCFLIEMELDINMGRLVQKWWG